MRDSNPDLPLEAGDAGKNGSSRHRTSSIMDNSTHRDSISLNLNQNKDAEPTPQLKSPMMDMYGVDYNFRNRF
jgi:hypothetical protein